MINSVFPTITFIDEILGLWVPELLRICLWGILAGILATLIYWFLSDQQEILRLKKKTQQFRREMLDINLDQEQFMLLVKENLVTSLAFLRKVFLPSILAASPVLVLAAWLSIFQGYAVPEANNVLDIHVTPVDSLVRVSSGINKTQETGHYQLIVLEPSQEIAFFDEGGILYSKQVKSQLAAGVNKKRWWNTILANEAGYIRDDSSAEEITFAYSRKTFMENVPTWLVTWEFPYFFSVFLAAIAAKFTFRIE